MFDRDFLLIMLPKENKSDALFYRYCGFGRNQTAKVMRISQGLVTKIREDHESMMSPREKELMEEMQELMRAPPVAQNMRGPSYIGSLQSHADKYIALLKHMYASNAIPKDFHFITKSIYAIAINMMNELPLNFAEARPNQRSLLVAISLFVMRYDGWERWFLTGTRII